ncbi:MAG: glycosyltransferase, partial [Kiritimatiellae bacterium]|nr:glycosyltransferase [Kiritimatiellia bacterium]
DCTHIWIFDDDMDVRRDGLENLLTVLPQLNTDGKLGVLRCWYHGNKETKPVAIDSFAWRGTLISSNVIRQVGLPDPGYFLYGEDVDYSLRIRKAGYSMYYVPQSIMWVNSSPTTKVTGRFFGREVAFHQSPYRLYYAVRNELYLYFKFHDARGLIKSAGYVFKLLIIIMGMKNIKKGQFVKALMTGVIHSIMGKRGKIPGYEHEIKS